MESRVEQAAERKSVVTTVRRQWRARIVIWRELTRRQ